MAEKQFSLETIAQELEHQFMRDTAANTLAKCTRSCFLSMKENELLPTEERCLRNCFVKSLDFHEYMEQQMRYTLRNHQ